MVLSITGDIARGGNALPSFFSVITMPAFSPESAVTKGSCLRKGRLRTPGASSQVEPGCSAEGGAFSRRRHRSLREMAEATAGGVEAKLVRPLIQRTCWLDGIGRGRAPHTAHVAYGSIAPFRPSARHFRFAPI